ncbi:MAG: phenylalanine--tRNA ligase subunit alpha [Dehalococcoidia bacterium]
MLEQLRSLAEEARTELSGSADEQTTEAWRVRYLGRNGRLTAVLRGLRELPETERREAGAAANALKQDLERELSDRQVEQRRAAVAQRLSRDRLDVTLPGRRPQLGRLHPVTQALRDVLAAFGTMGFQVAEGPEVEWDSYNFQKLRIPPGHPARAMQDTFYIDYLSEGEYPMLLRTHTSPNQIRVMERQQPPVRVVVPGRCYRNEATDPHHEWMITQVEVLAVDEGITMADLKGTLFEFARQMFGRERQVMFRHSYFPFTEPSAEMSVDCFLCRGAGCRTCGQTGWIELMGCGMVHPEALEGVGYDSSRYTGFAAGMGIERLALLRLGVDDIRHFYANDLRFLEQF